MIYYDSETITILYTSLVGLWNSAHHKKLLEHQPANKDRCLLLLPPMSDDLLVAAWSFGWGSAKNHSGLLRNSGLLRCYLETPM